MSKKTDKEDIDALVEDILEASGLNERRQAFVREYVATYNGKQSAITAGYSEKGADRQAYIILRNIEVAKTVRDIKRARAKALGSEHIDIIAFHSDVLHDPKSSIKEKDRAADRLSKLHGYYITKVQVSGKDDGPIEVAVSPSTKLKDFIDTFAARNEDE